VAVVQPQIAILLQPCVWQRAMLQQPARGDVRCG
jgi:hypothetical protein